MSKAHKPCHLCKKVSELRPYGHCRAAILPEDIVNGLGMVNKEMELRRRGKNRIDHAR